MAAVETVPAAGLSRLLARIPAAAQGLDWRPALKQIRVLLSAETKRNFVNARAPDGSAWKPLKRTSKRRGGVKAKPLRDTGLLMASITASGRGHVEELRRDGLTWGTNLNYAGYHQYGTRHIPARPFVGWNRRLADMAAKLLADFAAKALARKG